MTLESLGSLVAFLPVAMVAQSLSDPAGVPLNNWSAPRQLHRSQLQTQARVVKPQSQIPASATVQTQQRVLTPTFRLPGGVTPDSLIFVPMAPCRLADTRTASTPSYPALGLTPLAGLTPRTLAVVGSCGTPSVSNGTGPEAYSLNVTVVPPIGTRGGYLLVYPNPVAPIPLVASMTWNPSAVYQTGAVIAAASSDGSVNIVANSSTDVVVDINGYYAAPTDSGANTALGSQALPSDSTGTNNTAFGDQALLVNNAGSNNTALGQGALANNTSGISNTAMGQQAFGFTTGSYNVGLGHDAGAAVGPGSFNIMIGNAGSGSDDSVTRIGDAQIKVFIAGIYRVPTETNDALPVVISSGGQLGTISSSARFKEDIADMAGASSGLFRLRPVTYRYKRAYADGSKPIDYGLIAEEVAEVYPDLVVKGADGMVQAVQYQKLTPMLLNELQKEHRNAEQLARHSEEQDLRAEQQDETIRKLEARLVALEAQLANAASGKALPTPGP